MVICGSERNRIKLLVSLANFAYDYVNLHLLDDSKRKYIIKSFERKNGLKSLLRDMYDNEDSRFVDKYYENFSCTFGFHRRKVLPDCYVDVFNKLYLFLETYRYSSNDFDNFAAVVDDILGNNYSKDFLFNKERYALIDMVIKNPFYKDIPELRNFFKEIVLGSGDLEIVSSYSYYKSMLEMVDKAVNSNKDCLTVCSSIIDYAVRNYNNYRKPTIVDLVYSDNLVYGDRFSYLNDKLREIEPNFNIRNDMFSRISSLNNDIFNDLSEEEDYFKKCINIVLDSDTYVELTSKLNVLAYASSLYDSGNRKEAFDMLYLLGDNYHKEIIGGKVVEYSGVKPKTIIERMVNLYTSIDTSKTKEMILDAYSKTNSIGEFYANIGIIKSEDVFGEVEQEILPMKTTKLKRFVDRIIAKKGI